MNGSFPIQSHGPILTLRNEGGDEAGGSRHDVGGGEGNASADAFDGEQDEEGGRELHQTGDKEVDIDVSSQNAQPHDQTLVDHSTGEPAGEQENGGSFPPGVSLKDDQRLAPGVKTYILNILTSCS